MSEPSRIDWGAVANAWIDQDPDPNTRDELAALVVAGDPDALAERLGATLEFGTAGLRGVVGAGPNRMNQAVVTRVARGLAEHLLDRIPDARALPVVVGHDARLSSPVFAEVVVGVLVAAGLRVRYFQQAVPTPLVAYAAKQLGAVAAVVVTASHNPAEYNGIKVYAENAAQLGAPADAQVARRIAAVGPARAVPRRDALGSGSDPSAEPVPEALFERYLAELDRVRGGAGGARGLRIVYTPLHGVGARFVERALRRAGYTAVDVVPEQAAPDGRFPTVPRPNPEEPGVLDLAVRRATVLGADLLLANDPDADRLGVCVPRPGGGFVQLTGDQVGLLLADHLLAFASRTPPPLIVSTIVSSSMLERFVGDHGARLERTLTGFKWICNAGLALERQGGVRFLFGYEEALGYAVPIVRDKDGISAAVLFADLAARCRAEGKSVRERLDELFVRYGLWVNRPRSIVRSGRAGLAAITAAMDRLRRDPPTRLGGQRVVGLHDLAEGAATRPPWLGAADLVELSLQGGGRVLVRPSGTEPKLKIYTELCREVPHGANVAALEDGLGGVADAVSGEVAEHLGLC